MQIDFGGGFQIDVVAWLALALAAWGTWIAYRAERKADIASQPIVEAKIEPLEPHWWEVTIETRNRADHGLDGVSLKCVSPNGGLLMSPTFESTFNDDTFRIRPTPMTEQASRAIPAKIALAPKGAKEQLSSDPPEFEEDRKVAWLYVPTEAQSVELELILRTREHTPRDISYPIRRSLPAVAPRQETGETGN